MISYSSLSLLIEAFVEFQVSIARGNPRLAIESYKRSLKRTKFNEEEYNVGLHLPNPRFVLRTVEELISVIHKAKCSC